jgi:hypothetical protein
MKCKETTLHTHIQPVSAEGQIFRDFKIGGISLYYLSLPSSLSNGVADRDELLRD